MPCVRSRQIRAITRKTMWRNYRVKASEVMWQQVVEIKTVGGMATLVRSDDRCGHGLNKHEGSHAIDFVREQWNRYSASSKAREVFDSFCCGELRMFQRNGVCCAPPTMS